jgi:hypothetical protein
MVKIKGERNLFCMKLPSSHTSRELIDYVTFTENAKNSMATTGRWKSLSFPTDWAKKA